MPELIEKAVAELGAGTSQFKVLSFLAFRGPSPPSAIGEEIGIPAGTVRPALRGLLDKGYVVQQQDGAYKSLIPFTDIISHIYTAQKK